MREEFERICNNTRESVKVRENTGIRPNTEKIEENVEVSERNLENPGEVKKNPRE